MYKAYCLTSVKFDVNAYIHGEGPEGHLVLKLENEVGPPLKFQNYVNFNKNQCF